MAQARAAPRNLAAPNPSNTASRADRLGSRARPIAASPFQEPRGRPFPFLQDVGASGPPATAAPRRPCHAAVSTRVSVSTVKEPSGSI